MKKILYHIRSFLIVAALVFFAIVISCFTVQAYDSPNIGDKFISKTGDIIELVQRIPVYAPDDSCLAMQRQGYAIYCQPVPISYRWEVIIYHYGIEIQGITDDEDLKELGKVR